MTMLGRQKLEWNKEEVRTLKKYFRIMSNQSLANVLERTVKSIERKAAKIGLLKTKKYLKTLGR